MKAFIVTLLILTGFNTSSIARLLFVDAGLSGDCSNYNYLTRQCGSGIYTAFKTITSAAAIAVSGDTVVFRGGTYNEQLAPKNSGTALTPILYSSFIGETVTITGSSLAPAIWIYELNYIIIQGITVSNVQRWASVLGSHHIVLHANAFLNANDGGGSSKTGLFFQGSDYNIISNNIIDNSTQDNLALVQSNHNLIESNRITSASHSLWTIKCGSFNVLRKNYFHNEHQKIGEIYDCDNVGYGDFDYPKLTSLDNTKYNVVEDNVFAYTSTPINASPYAGIQLAAQHTIVRRNVFYHCLGPPIDLTLYGEEAKYNYSNRIYNNVFYDNQFGGLSVSGLSGGGYVFYDNMCRNNVFYRNRFTTFDTRWEWYATLSDKPVQIITGRNTDIKFDHNDIFNSTANELWVIAKGTRTSTSNPSPQTLSWWQTNHSEMFSENVQIEPDFIDTIGFDFHLRPTSNLVDAGAFLARAIGTGTFTILKVDSAGYFRDNFGIEALGGDTIQIEGHTERAVILSINYQTNTLTLDKPLSWINGERVSLKYNGAAPDIGAFESGAGSISIRMRNKSESATTVRFYPNPTSGQSTVFLAPGMPAVSKLQIIDMLGRCVRNTLTDSEIDITDRPAGMYVVRIAMGSSILTGFLIKE